jgi:uncharacterized membrane protein HdeD (DUF308 family)
VADPQGKCNLGTLSVVSLICGLISIFVFPMAFGGAAIIMGVMVMQRVDDKESREYGNARIGIIAGIVGIVLWIVTLFTMGYMGIDTGNLFGGQTPQSAF